MTDTANTTTAETDLKQWLLILLSIIFVILLFRTAWLCDDAFITYRSVDHFVNGRGMVFNVGERVQTFTHPLWMLLVSFFYFFTGEMYFTPILLSILLSSGAVFLFAFKIAENRGRALVGLSALIFSQAFIDYSTSGLENPLTHFLLALFTYFFLKKPSKEVDADANANTETAAGITPKKLFTLSLLGALLITNRMDTLLLVAPALGFTCFRLLKSKALTWKTCLKKMALGFLPFILWEAFSLLYYGFLFPNTAYAKLSTGIARWDLIEQGFYYFIHSLGTDPLTISMILWSLILLFLARGKHKSQVFLGAGILLYLVYILWIGGDFMMGRFLAAPLFMAVMVFPPLPGKTGFKELLLVPVILLVGFVSENPPLLAGKNYGLNQRAKEKIGMQGVANERAYYYNDTGLLRARRRGNLTALRDHAWKIRDDFRLKGKIFQVGGLGYFGFFTEPGDHVIDHHALADPLLARLPVDREWRIGHFPRSLPDGYADTLASGKNKIKDPDLAKFYDKLSLITRGPVFSFKRFKEITVMNLGGYKNLVQKFNSRKVIIPPAQLSLPKPDKTPWDAEGNIIMGSRGIWVEFTEPRHAPIVEFSLGFNDVYQVELYTGDELLESFPVPKRRRVKKGLALRKLTVPYHIQRTGFTAIRIFPDHGDGKYSIGHLVLKE